MLVLHVDENGNPDQGLGKVLVMVLLMLAVVATAVVSIVLLILSSVGVIPAPR